MLHRPRETVCSCFLRPALIPQKLVPFLLRLSTFLSRPPRGKYVVKKIPIELLNQVEKQQAFKEVELLRALSHPNIVKFNSNFLEEQILHIVMECCEGGDLAGYLKKQKQGGRGLVAEAQILDWFMQICLALRYIHEEHHIMHRDLKTSNIFLKSNNVVKLGDFGIARVLEGTLEQAKTVVGTPYYMSPEVCENKPYSYKSDVWALGCVLYEMCTLKHAFDANNLLGLVYKIVQEDYPPISDHYSRELSNIVTLLLTKDVHRRPGLEQILASTFLRSHARGMADSGGSLGEKVPKRAVLRDKSQPREQRERIRGGMFYRRHPILLR